MAFKRITDINDVDRLAERVHIQAGRRIEDKTTAQLEIIRYLTQDGDELSTDQQNKLIPKVIARLAQRNANLREDVRKSGSEARERKRKGKPQKIPVKIRGESYLVEPPNEPKLNPRQLEESKKFKFDILGSVKGKTVFVRRKFVTVKGKKTLRYISKNGRFAKRLT